MREAGRQLLSGIRFSKGPDVARWMNSVVETLPSDGLAAASETATCVQNPGICLPALAGWRRQRASRSGTPRYSLSFKSPQVPYVNWGTRKGSHSLVTSISQLNKLRFQHRIFCPQRRPRLSTRTALTRPAAVLVDACHPQGHSLSEGKSPRTGGSSDWMRNGMTGNVLSKSQSREGP